MTEPGKPYWEGPYLDTAQLDNDTREGDVCIDDVGELRQRRYGTNHMSSGWTAQGRFPLSSEVLLEGGNRPVWVLRMENDGQD